MYSLIALARGYAPLMTRTDGGDMLTLTYYWRGEGLSQLQRQLGVAKAGLEAAGALSRGFARYEEHPRQRYHRRTLIKTLAARGIGDFSQILNAVTARALLHRNVEQIEVGNTKALFLCATLGQRHHWRNHLRRLRLQRHWHLSAMIRITANEKAFASRCLRWSAS